MASSSLMAADADIPGQSPPHGQRGHVELGVERHGLSDGFGQWQGAYLRGIWRPGTANTLNYELVDSRRFGQSGRYAALGLTRNFDDRWYGSASVGVGDGAFFWPDWRVDLTINRKWLANRSLVGTLGYTHYVAPDGHVDRTALLALAWYAPHHFIFQGGVRPNRSSPGGIRSESAFAAVTWGEDGKQYLSLRHDRGREAYQTIGQDVVLVDFPSRVTAVTWRRWVTARCGYNLRLEHYESTVYERKGGEAGIFCGF